MSDAIPHSLRCERIRLRRLALRDAPALLALYGDPAVMRYWSHAPWTTLDDAKAAIGEAHSDYALGRSLHLAIEHLATGTLIGSCAVYDIVRPARRASLGYLLCRHAWGQGYAREALSALLRCAMEELDLNRIEAEVDPDNTASVKVLTGLGFELEGRLRERWVVAGEALDIALYALLRRHWRERQEGRPAPAFTQS